MKKTQTRIMCENFVQGLETEPTSKFESLVIQRIMTIEPALFRYCLTHTGDVDLDKFAKKAPGNKPFVAKNVAANLLVAGWTTATHMKLKRDKGFDIISIRKRGHEKQHEDMT